MLDQGSVYIHYYLLHSKIFNYDILLFTTMQYGVSLLCGRFVFPLFKYTVDWLSFV
jgi:hypothetical protein